MGIAGASENQVAVVLDMPTPSRASSLPQVFVSCANAVNIREPNVGAGLLAKAEGQFAVMLDVPTPSRASSLPQVLCRVQLL